MTDSRSILLTLRQALLAALGDDLLGLYCAGETPRQATAAGATGAFVWLLIRPQGDLQKVRDAFLPLWAAHAAALGQGPAVATPADWARYQQLFPHQVQLIRARARLLAGEDVLSRRQGPGARDTLMQLAQVAGETLRCSALLAPASVKPKKRADLQERLRDLTAGWTPYKVERDDPKESLEALHAYLAAQQNAFPAYRWLGAEPAEPPPPPLPGLLSLVGLANELIIVMPRVDRSMLSRTNWRAVAGLVADEFGGILLATPWQLRLTASVAWAADLTTGSFERVWGSDLLSDCRPTDSHILASQAMQPARVLVEKLPPAYCTVQETELPKLVHDLQNTLLNIQLQAEVVARRRGTPVLRPPEALPGRETPPHRRIAAIVRQFRWWSAQLTPQSVL